MQSQIGTDGMTEVTAIQIAAEFGLHCRAGYRHLKAAATT